MTTTYKQYSIADAPADSRAALERIRETLGFVPNLFATLAESPVTLEGYITLDTRLARGTLTPVERQIVATAVSTANGCTYCAAAHSTLARQLRAPGDAVAAARGEGMASDARLAALVRFVHAVVRKRGRIESTELRAFLSAGFTPAQALEVVANVGLKTISNYIDGFAQVPLDAAFEASRWQPVSAAA